MKKPEVSVIIPVYNNALYLYDTLQSVKDQSFTDYEVIVVNDGSSDGSEAVIDQFVREDHRFIKISQENQGVSAARNAGLAIAKGNYVTFVDGDDTLPEYSLQEMDNIARNYRSDLVIGGIQRIDGTVKKVNQRTERLKNKRILKKDDLDLVHGLSLCNKWFLKEIIDENHLRLEAFRHLEDGVFLYNFLQYAKKIHSCDAVIYNYLKRIPVYTGSVTQKVEKGLLENAISAFERMQLLTEGYSEAFQQELAYRINSTTFIGDYYKKIWQLDETTERLLIEQISKIWETQSEEHREKTIASHPGMELEKGFRTKEELLKDPLFLIGISPEISEDKVNYILKSIYGQSVAGIHIVLDRKFEKTADPSFVNMKNLTFADFGNTQRSWVDCIMDCGKSKYFMILDQNVIFDYDTLAKAYGLLKRSNCHMLKVKVSDLDQWDHLTGLIFHSGKIQKEPLIFDRKQRFKEKEFCKHREIVVQKNAQLQFLDSSEAVQKKDAAFMIKKIRKGCGKVKRALMQTCRIGKSAPKEVIRESHYGILLYSDGWHPCTATENIEKRFQDPVLREKLCLSYKTACAENYWKNSAVLFEHCQAAGIEGKYPYTEEQKNIRDQYRAGKLSFEEAAGVLKEFYENLLTQDYGESVFDLAVLYDTIDVDRIMEFSHFQCEKYLFVWQDLFEMLSDGNVYMKDAVEYFVKCGGRLLANTLEIKDYMEKTFFVSVDDMENPEAFEALLRRAAN